MTPPAIDRLNAALEGRYRIEDTLGEGGMATVYLADDLRHGRKVALKVLKPELAAVVGAERFLTEIRTTANLQHPHILPLYDSGQADSFLFYVMPYVEGESLRDRLNREKQLPVDEAVRIASAVANALDHAHRRGVVHRDIKPGNILLQDGEPVVADFGIALAVGAGGGNRLTETGLSLGTPFYMSPEQATGDQTVGPASDVYSLACVLYEMLVGDPPFPGSTAQAVLGKIIAGERVSVTAHRPAVPAHVDAAVRCALEKLPADRFPSAQAFSRALAERGFRHGEAAGAGPRAPGAPAWALASAAVAVASTLSLGWALLQLRPGPAGTPGAAFVVSTGEDPELYLGSAFGTTWGRPALGSLAMSPAGDVVVFSAWDEGPGGTIRSQLYLRPIGQEQADPIPGTEGAFSPFFSPDGQWLGFHLPGEGIRRIGMSDGRVETLVPDGSFEGSSWADDGTIVTAGRGQLYTIPSSGGDPSLLAAADSVLPGFEYGHPHVLPESRGVLFTGKPFRDDWEEADVYVLDLGTGTRTLLVENATNPHYAAPGHLLFVRQGTLMAVGFNLDPPEVEGDPVVVLSDIMQSVGMPNSASEFGVAQVALSRAGDLAYARGGLYPPRLAPLVNVTPTGTREVLDFPSQDWLTLRISPDGDRLAFSVGSLRETRLRVRDLVRGVTQDLDVGGFRTGRPEWSRDGRFLAFSSDHEDWVGNIYRIASDGSGGAERLAPSTQSQSVMSWSSDDVIAYLEDGDIWTLPPGGAPTRFFESDASEQHATFSPDGRWMAYSSNPEGTREIYVRPYPGPGIPTKVSTGGGSSPMWSPEGGRLYYLTLEEADGVRTMMAANIVERGNDLVISPPEPFIEGWLYGTATPSRPFDMLPDGTVLSYAREEAERFNRDRYRVSDFHVKLDFLALVRERVGN